ncbi:DUF4407 domain-containing protein [Rhodococcus sp. B10]|uniref:DUF4407 domain-containing protein n=1 Tax=Rhodococcus sp. B10 TaxID=2695876 RepID=UPI0014308394|nr:DUF4407 domain-containing protein [Rhodococcus sp. B10]NIL74890.1 hypothetical protein [Rhodococcus sp. B10]
MKLKYFLARLAGARIDVLEKLPGALPKQSAMGAVLLTTAGFAAISAGYALSITGIASGIFAVLGGLVWGIAILNLDRLLVIGLAKETGWKRNLSLAAPRIVLAVILGVVISTPLMLRVFDSEIAAQMNRNILTAQEDLRESINNSTIRQDLNADIEELNRLRALINAGPTADVSQNPEVLLAQQAIDDLEAKAATQKAEYDQLRAAAVAEEEGSAGTMIRGCAALCIEKRRLADESEARWQDTLNQVRDKENEMAAIVSKVQVNALDSSERAIADAEAVVPGLQEQVDQLTEQVNSAQDTSRELEQANAGIIARLKALSDVSGNDATAAMARYAVALLFMAMELLPVIFKIVSNLGSRTAYDTVVDSHEAAEVERATQSVTLADEKAKLRRSSEQVAEKDRTDKQQELMLRINASVAEHQAAVVEEALSRWSDHAKRVSDDRLDQWADEMERSYNPGRAPVYGSNGGFQQHADYGYPGPAPATTMTKRVNNLNPPSDL